MLRRAPALLPLPSISPMLSLTPPAPPLRTLSQPSSPARFSRPLSLHYYHGTSLPLVLSFPFPSFSLPARRCSRQLRRATPLVAVLPALLAARDATRSSGGVPFSRLPADRRRPPGGRLDLNGTDLPARRSPSTDPMRVLETKKKKTDRNPGPPSPRLLSAGSVWLDYSGQRRPEAELQRPASWASLRTANQDANNYLTCGLPGRHDPWSSCRCHGKDKPCFRVRSRRAGFDASSTRPQ